MRYSKSLDTLQGLRYNGTLARWHAGTLARWHAGTLARWHAGTLAQ
jgi:hypothetical protein